MACKGSSPAGEAPPTYCPICLETWDSQDHLPKFLLCHHSVCVSCVALLYKAALKHAPTPSTSPSTPISPLTRLMGSRSSLNAAVENEEPTGSSWIKCPLCRTSTFILDPSTLQTNFYLRGLLRSPSLPRLVLWCDTCNSVAAPSCLHHTLRPLQDKMHRLQEELIAAAGEACAWACGRVAVYEKQVEVYRWACKVLRHAHTRVLAALTHAQHQHRALSHFNTEILQLVNRGEALQGVREAEEEVISGLENVVKEVKEKHEQMSGGKEIPTLRESFHVCGSHKGPQGYRFITLEAHDTLTLTLHTGDETESQETDSNKDDTKDTQLQRTFHSLQARHRKTSAQSKGQVTRSVSLRDSKGGSSVKDLDKESQCPSQASTKACSDSCVKNSPNIAYPRPQTSVSDTVNLYEPEDPINDPLAHAGSINNNNHNFHKMPTTTSKRDATHKATASIIPHSHQDAEVGRQRRSDDNFRRYQRSRGHDAPTRITRHRSRHSRRRAGKPRCSIM